MDNDTLKQLSDILAKELPCRKMDAAYSLGESLTVAEFLRQNAESIEIALESKDEGAMRERIRDIGRLVGLNALRLLEAADN